MSDPHSSRTLPGCLNRYGLNRFRIRRNKRIRCVIHCIGSAKNRRLPICYGLFRTCGASVPAVPASGLFHSRSPGSPCIGKVRTRGPLSWSYRHQGWPPVSGIFASPRPLLVLFFLFPTSSRPLSSSSSRPLLPLPYIFASPLLALFSPPLPSPPTLSSSYAPGFFTLAHLAHSHSLSAASAAFRPLSPPRASPRRLATPPEEAWSHPREADPALRGHPGFQYFPSRHAARGHRSRVRKQWPPTPEPPPQHRSR